MNEHSYIKAVTRHIPKSLYRWKIADPFAGGVPDFFLEGETRDLWVEFKYLKNFPKRPNTLIDLTHTKYLSKLQQQWLLRRNQIRGDCCVVLGCEHGGYIFTGASWLEPVSAEFLKDNCLLHNVLALRLIKMI